MESIFLNFYLTNQEHKLNYLKISKNYFLCYIQKKLLHTLNFIINFSNKNKFMLYHHLSFLLLVYRSFICKYLF